jgi:ribosomal protein L12E/L44/L45/RPP1/RPP2
MDEIEGNRNTRAYCETWNTGASAKEELSKGDIGVDILDSLLSRAGLEVEDPASLWRLLKRAAAVKKDANITVLESLLSHLNFEADDMDGLLKLIQAGVANPTATRSAVNAATSTTDAAPKAPTETAEEEPAPKPAQGSVAL